MRYFLFFFFLLSSFFSISNAAEYTPEHHPNIGGLYKTVLLNGTTFDPMNKVMAYDCDDGYITSKVTITGTVNTSSAGEYSLFYSVTNSAMDTKTIERKVIVLPAGEIALIKTTGRRGPNDIIDLDATYEHTLADNLTYIKPIVIAPLGTVYEYKLIDYYWDKTSSTNPNIGIGHKDTEPDASEWSAADTKEFYKDLYLCMKPRIDRWLKITITYNGSVKEVVYGLKGDTGTLFTSPLDGADYYYPTKEVDDSQTSAEQYEYYKHGCSYWFPESNVTLKKMGSRAKVSTGGSIAGSYKVFEKDEIHGIYTLARAFGPGDKRKNTSDNWKTIMDAWNHTMLQNMNSSYHRTFQPFFSECKMPHWMDAPPADGFEKYYRELRQNYNPNRILVAVSNFGAYTDYKNFYDEPSPYFQFEWHKGHFPKMYSAFPSIGDNYHCYSFYPRINEVFSPTSAALSFETHRKIHALAMRNRISASIMDKCGFMAKLPDDSDWSKFACMYYAMWFCYDGYDFLNTGDYFIDDWDGDGLSNEDELINDTDPFDPDTDDDCIYDKDEVFYHLNPKVSDGDADADHDGISNYQEVILTVETRQIPTGTPPFKPLTHTDANGNTITISPENPEDAMWDDDHDLLPVGFEINTGANPVDLHTFKNGEKGAFIWLIDVAKDYAGMTKMIAYNNNIINSSKDIDGDGIKNIDEIDMGLNPSDPVDALEDLDGDGIDNITEFQQGNTIWKEVTAPPVFNSQIVKQDAFINQEYKGNLVYDTSAPNVGQIFTFSKKNGPGWLTIDSTGLIHGTPSQSDAGLNTFDIEVADSAGRTDQATFTIDVISEPETHLLTVNSGSGSGTYAKGTQVNITADKADLGKVFDKWSGDTAKVENIYAAKSYITVSDSDLTITAEYRNDTSNTAPVAGNDFYKVKYNTTKVVISPGVLLNDSDPDGDSISIIQTSSPLHGAVTLDQDGAFSYIPEKGYYGVDSFKYKISDGSSESNEAVVTFTIINTPPKPVNDKYSTPQDVTLTIPAPGVLDNDINKENDSLTATLVSSPASGSLTLNGDGSFSYIPVAGFTGDVTFSYNVSDGITTSSDGVVTITVSTSGVNIPPTSCDDEYDVTEGTLFTLAAPGVLLNDSDANGDSLHAVLSHYPSHGVLVLNSDGSLTYTPVSGYTGNDFFTYRAQDTVSASNLSTVKLNIKPASNIPPTAESDHYFVYNDETLTVPASGLLLNDTDANSDSLTADLVTDVQHGNLTLNSDGSFSYIPDITFSGDDSFSYRAYDGSAYSTASLVTITVNHRDIPKYILTVNSGSGSGEYEAGTQVAVSSTPPAGKTFISWEGDTKYLADRYADSTTLTMPEVNISITPNYEEHTLALTLGASSMSENGGIVQATISRNKTTGGELILNLSSSDTTEATVPSTVTIPAGNSSAVFTVTGVDDHLIDGTQSVTLSASAPGYTNISATILVVDDDAVGFLTTPSSLTIEEDHSGTFSIVLTSEPKTDVQLTLTSSNQSAINLSSSSLTFTKSNWSSPQTVTVSAPDNSLNGNSSASITVAVDDNNSDDDFDPLPDQTVSVSVTDDDPDAVDDTASVSPNSTVVIDVLGNDSDPQNDALTISSITSAPAEGTAVITDSGTTITYTSGPNIGTVTFNYQASDNNGGTAEATVTIDISNSVTLGSKITVYASSINGMDSEFSRNPVIYGRYTDPSSGKEVTATTKAISKISTSALNNKFECVWNRAVSLYDRKAYRVANKSGISTDKWIQSLPDSKIKSLKCQLFCKATNSAKGKIDVMLKSVTIPPPSISDITGWDGQPLTGGIHSGSIIVIQGNYFSSKTPGVYLEYKDQKGKIKRLKLKILAPLKFADLRGSKGRSSMNLNSPTGYSELKVAMPLKWPKGFTPGDYTVILDNKLALAVYKITITDVSTGPTVANDDQVTLIPGNTSYIINILKNDTDANADRAKIILKNYLSDLGCRLSLVKGKVLYTPLKDIQSGSFPDSFTYALDDSHGNISGDANVTINMHSITLDPPKHWNGTALTGGGFMVQPGSRIILSGKNFGIKAPFVNLHYIDSSGTPGKLKLKVVSQPPFRDYRGGKNRSYTNLNVSSANFAKSSITVELPSKEWPGYAFSTNYQISVSNVFDRQGANVTVTTFDGNDNPPVAASDNVTIYSGKRLYYIDVLGHLYNPSGVVYTTAGTDTDRESGKMTIILPKTSAMGGKLAVDKASNTIKYSRPKGVFCNFTDTFEYSIEDSAGNRSSNVNVTITGNLNK
jgi:VCBS repeat-containing protein